MKMVAGKRRHYAKVIQEAIHLLNYRYERYDFYYSVAIGFCPEPIDMTPLATFIRESDQFIILENNLCAVVLEGANDASGIKAANKFLSHFEGSFFSMPLYAAVVTASNYDATSKLTHDLFNLLDYAIAHNMKNMVIDPSQVHDTKGL